MPEGPHAGESKTDWMSRCVKYYKEEGKKASKARDICYARWEEKHSEDE